MAPTSSALSLRPPRPRTGKSGLGSRTRRDPITSSGDIERRVRQQLSASSAPSVVTMGIPYEVFTEMLNECLQMRALHIGCDFALGAGREGTPERLRELGVDVQTHPLVMAAGGQAKVSSTTIRRLISQQRISRQTA
jgi:hypothetical protein